MQRNLLCAAALLATVACNTNPGKDKAHAEVSAALKEAPKTEQEGNLVKYPINASNSSIEFVGAKITKSHDGQFDTFNGSLNLVDDNPTKSSLSVEIQMASLQLEPAKLAKHLKAPDFFDIAKYPTTEFTTTSLKKGKRANEFTVTGNLTLRGIKKSITFPASITINKGSLAIEAEFAINRKDFGIVYTGMANDLIKDNILIKLNLNPKKS